MKKKTKQVKEKRVRRNLKPIFWGVGAFLALIIVMVLIVILNQPEKISDDYFVTDDKKIVMSMEAEIAALENGEYEPEITHLVYLHNGKEATGVKVYYEYASEDEARAAYDNITIDYFATGKKLNGKYIVMDARGDTFEGALVEDIEKQAASMEAAGALVVEEETSQE